ncbi:hypothetical protein GHYDROH2_03640 [Geobacter hydrogenophilus]|uniref:Lipoprotein n=2 Tax=Geobacter hydrogenophilus TaxID=40983 RepID=A0A9W6FY04_9BACT|nr:hypothetical protein GHYDROH2_03640 [Geobacter hydrogenophilus]
MRYVAITGLFVTLMLACSACTPAIYGVPQPEWQKLTDAQRLEAIRGYNVREKLREEQRLRQAEREAKEAEIQAMESRRRQEDMQRQVEGIYRGDAGHYGDLIRVTIQGGQFRFGSKNRSFQPVALKIANGETKRVEIVSHERYATYRAELYLRYLDGLLLFDTDGRLDGNLSRLVYEPGWRRGRSYVVTSPEGRGLHEVQVSVEVVPHLREGEVHR